MKKLLTLLLCIPSIFLPADNAINSKVLRHLLENPIRKTPVGPEGQDLTTMAPMHQDSLNIIDEQYTENGTVMAEINGTQLDIIACFSLSNMKSQLEKKKRKNKK